MTCFVELFGGLCVHHGSGRVTRFRTQKTGALLAYLAYHQDRMHSREVLADLFWPAAAPSEGRGSLSMALSSLRKQLEPPGTPRDAVLRADYTSVGVSPGVVTDVRQFNEKLDLVAGAGTEARESFWTEALSLYRPALLPGFYEEWIEGAQERLRARFLGAVGDFGVFLEERARLPEAIA